MSDRIIVERLAVFGRHGVLPEEGVTGQRFLVSLEGELDLRPAGLGDDVARTVSYAELAALAVEIATTRRFALIEALAETIAAAALARFPRLEAITVRVDKPGAPVPAIFDAVAVVITRRRDG